MWFRTFQEQPKIYNFKLNIEVSATMEENNLEENKEIKNHDRIWPICLKPWLERSFSDLTLIIFDSFILTCLFLTLYNKFKCKNNNIKYQVQPAIDLASIIGSTKLRSIKHLKINMKYELHLLIRKHYQIQKYRNSKSYIRMLFSEDHSNQR